MKKPLLFLLLISFLSYSASAQTTTKIFDKVTFYDGYNTVVSTDPVPDGVIRFRNDLYSTKLTDTQIQSLGSTLTAKVTITASCDDYDRIGNLNLAFVPKGATTYDPKTAQRIELGRYITPFMDKNVTPNQVPYSLVIDNITNILKDPTINANYDFWIELQLFGVPYSARTEITGCAGRSDTFFGTLELISNATTPATTSNYLLPLDFQNELRPYKAGGSDALNDPERTYNFVLPADVSAAKLYLVMSNHGSGTNGEEYTRRGHFCSWDGKDIYDFRPGEDTCEPYRQYSTRSNGIYGSSPMTNAQWQSFSNWCPGAKIPTRVISLGNIAAGSHSFNINIPEAAFAGKDGYFPISLYLQGTSTATLGIEETKVTVYSLYPNPSKDIFNISASEEIKSVKVYNMLGQEIWMGNTNQIDLSHAEFGVYTASILFANGNQVSQKIIKG